ncbi:MAG: hypothetical protein KAG97_13200, partial [Victivallales bacterium]|nr:hypothetical protein [Victivallales bacterium]
MPKNFRTLIVASAIFAGMFFSDSTHDRNDAVKTAVKAEKPNVVVSKKLTSSHFKSTPRLQKSDERPAAKVSTRKNQESDADHRFRKDMVLRINEIILKTQQNSPVLASELTDDLKLSLLKVFTAALGDGLEYVPALEFKKPRRNGANENGRSYFKSILIALGKVLYLRIDCFDEVALKGLRKDSANLAESATKPLGLIIDLRSASGTNYDLILKSLALFSGAESKLEKSKRATA